MVLFKIDAEKGEGTALADEFNIKGYPTFVATNADAQTIRDAIMRAVQTP